MLQHWCGGVGGIVLFLSCAGPAEVADAADDVDGKSKLASFERFIGEWTVNGKWASGDELHARTVYAWGVNKQIITAKTFVKDKDNEYQRYEGVLAWHPKKKSLYEISFVFNGEIHEVLIDMKDADTLHIGYTPFDDKEPSNVRQILHFKDKDTFTWTVSMKTDTGWTQLIEADWHRK
jgi:hypothetical protein